MTLKLEQDPYLDATWNVFAVDDKGEPLQAPEAFMAIFTGKDAKQQAKAYLASKAEIAALQSKVEWLVQPILR
jgi:5-carboxymethyl-2-hydroxymuconate isomerase